MVAAAAGRWSPRLTNDLLSTLVLHNGGICAVTPVGAAASPTPGWWCAAGQVRIVEAVLAGAGLVLLALAVRWALRPLRDVAALIRNVGPQGLSHRVTAGRFTGVTVQLAEAINQMLERVSVGYDSQRRFAAAASHELRTPLAVQRALIEVGLANNPGPAKVAVVAEQLLAANERNVQLIEALLVLSESDRGLAARGPVRLDLIVENVLVEHRAAAERAAVTISSALQPRTVDGEQVLLERMVTNLVQNAIKYNRPGGTIHVAVAARPALTIANSGDDVPESETLRLFEPFQRLGADRMNRPDGVGLGLTIVRSIAQAHDGAVNCHTTGRDGLRFDVVLPQPPGR
uniref:sensor histidine kinase n=1 Tax=Paractinoplanes polyasparticus TaxID=2856853 RepID=UPI0027E12AA8|nr:HAMP domain-containing sensor histidine kinase [Actinoplanes polyasparticus]